MKQSVVKIKVNSFGVAPLSLNVGQWKNSTNKAFKSDSQRLAFSLRSSIAKRRSHLNAALCF
ncbi:hypothetical protein FKN90_17565 [Vibrio sp. 2017_1457_15]|nr:hypothetical protein [Vibrio sp. 2017_1457_15]MDQ2162950.1 hypothetical protein [Vibrio sp. 2017_1457_13]MDQ2195010.1 hypothetical protein [Vibrio sp. A14(2019)]